MPFAEAYKHMLEGKRIRRPSFKGYWYLSPETGALIINIGDGKDIKYGNLDVTVKNCLANDWEVVDA